MKIRAICLGPIPPIQAGGHISRGQIFAGMAAAGHEICAVAPISEDALKSGDWFAAQNPELRVIRYWLPDLSVEVRQPTVPDVDALESDRVEHLVMELTHSFRPNILISGRESFARITHKLATKLALPWCLLLRGRATGDVVEGRTLETSAVAFLDHVKSADLVISVAEHLANGLRRNRGIEGIVTIPNAVDLDAFRPDPTTAAVRTEFGIPDGHAVVMLVGSLVPHKRPADFLRAAELVAKSNQAVTFLIAGDGILEDELAAACRAGGLADTVRLLGEIPNARMPALYNAADVVVLTSDSEGISRVCLEAMACGRPLLASDIPGNREVIEDGRNGFVFPLGDHQALARRLHELLGDDTVPARIAQSARASVSHRRLEQSIEMYVHEISTLLATAHGTSTE